MRWNHAICTDRHNLTIMFDLIDNYAEPIQLSKVFILHKIIFTSNIQDFGGFAVTLEKNLFMLS